MVFNLTKEQQMIQMVIRDFAKREVEPIAAEVDALERFPRETFEKMADAQMLGLPFPVEYGVLFSSVSFCVAPFTLYYKGNQT